MVYADGDRRYRLDIICIGGTLQSQQTYVLNFRCRNSIEPHFYRGTSSTVDLRCSCGELIDFATIADAGPEFIKYTEQLSAYLGLPTNFVKFLLRKSCHHFFDKGNRRMNPGATLSLFKEEYGEDAFNGFAIFVEALLHEFKQTKEFWALYFSAYSTTFHISNEKQKINFVKYKRTYSKKDFFVDVARTKTAFSVFEGKSSDEKLEFMCKLFLEGRPDLTEKYVLWYFKNGFTAKKFNKSLTQKATKPKRNKGTYPVVTPLQAEWEQSAGWVRGAGKGGIHNWKRY